MKFSCHHDRYDVCHRCEVILASPEELAVMDASRRPVAVIEGERRWGV